MTRQIDVHGRSVLEAMRAFVAFYNDCLRSGYRGGIEVIHGYGSSGAGGVILQELRNYLAANAGRLESFIQGESVGNLGVTIVYPKKILPPWRTTRDIQAKRASGSRRSGG
jgi:dsDNA-specific endonuclease/ATPase MutS2